MKKKSIIIVLAIIFVIAVATALVFYFSSWESEEVSGKYTSMYRGNKRNVVTIKIEKDTPLLDNQYWHIVNSNGNAIEYKVVSKHENSIKVRVKGLSPEEMAYLSVFVSEDPENFETIYYEERNEEDNQAEDNIDEETNQEDHISLENIPIEEIDEELLAKLEESFKEPIEVIDERTGQAVKTEGEKDVDTPDESVPDNETIDENEYTVWYSMTAAIYVTSNNKLEISDLDLFVEEEPYVLFEEGDVVVKAKKKDDSFTVYVPSEIKKIKVLTEKGLDLLAVEGPDELTKETVAIITPIGTGEEKVLIQAPYDDVNLVLTFSTVLFDETTGESMIELKEYNGSDDVDISMFDYTDYGLMAETLTKLPIASHATISEFAMMDKEFNQGTDICRISLMYQGKKIEYVVTEKLKMDAIVSDIASKMGTVACPLKEETIGGTSVKGYTYGDTKDVYNVMYFTTSDVNCLLISSEADWETFKNFVSNIEVKSIEKS